MGDRRWSNYRTAERGSRGKLEPWAYGSGHKEKACKQVNENWVGIPRQPRRPSPEAYLSRLCRGSGFVRAAFFFHGCRGYPGGGVCVSAGGGTFEPRAPGDVLAGLFRLPKLPGSIISFLRLIASLVCNRCRDRFQIISSGIYWWWVPSSSPAHVPSPHDGCVLPSRPSSEVRLFSQAQILRRLPHTHMPSRDRWLHRSVGTAVEPSSVVRSSGT